MRAAVSSIFTRLASIDDVEVVARLFDAYRQFYEQAPDLPLARAFMRARIERKESVVIVAEDAHRVMYGFCQLYPGFCSVAAAPIYTLYDLFVTPQARRSGAGRALLRAAERHAAGQGVVRLDLSTALTNRQAQALYESEGWIRDTEFLVYSKDVRI